MAISGNAAIVGAYQDDDGGTWSGSAYVYRFDGSDWDDETKLVASDDADYDYFGISVSISENSGDTILKY